MGRRIRDAGLLAGFLLALAVQFLFHVHLLDDRHHTADCAGERPSTQEGPALTGTEPIPAPGHLPHQSCARCVTPAAALRFTALVIAAPETPGALALNREPEAARTADELGYELRGPPESRS